MPDNVTEIEENGKTWITQFNLLVAGILILLTVLGVDVKITAAIAGVATPLVNIGLRIANKKGWI